MKTKYESDDGIIFDNAKDCASHELTVFPEKLEKLIQKMDLIPTEYQKRWCNSVACACMGCANFEVREAGLEKEHWEIWNELYRKDKVFWIGLKKEHNLDVKDFLLKINENKRGLFFLDIPDRKACGMAEYLKWGRSVLNDNKIAFVCEDKREANKALSILNSIFDNQFIINEMLVSIDPEKFKPPRIK